MYAFYQWWGSARQRKREQRRQREIYKAAEAEATSGKMEAAEAEGEAISWKKEAAEAEGEAM